jgi:hypothetical protein
MLLAFAARADIIYFNDGLKTICQERAWEEGDQVKCEYGGYIIVYKKSDVSRILRTSRPQNPTPKLKNEKKVEKRSGSHRSDLPKMTPSKTAGLVFYDPRRPFKYWTAKNAKHKSYDEAIQALAKKYNRPPEWIKANMGDTNDLTDIHRKLAQQKPLSTTTTQNAKQPIEKQPEIEFYNPRRSSPYWTSASSKHKSFKEAIQAFASQYNRSPEWIRKNMGQTNDLGEIHSTLRMRDTQESSN